LIALFKKFAHRKPRLVLDTNIPISATIVPQGFPARILTAALDGNITLVVSEKLLDEYMNVVRRPHISRRYRTVTQRIQDFSIFLLRDAVYVSGVPVTRIVQDDPEDDFVIASAVEGKAHYIVSGDEHLLQLGTYRGIKILTPRDFVVDVLGETIR
jgi:hypothetical protein